MADLQSMNLAIGGIGGDPSGSHPYDLMKFWSSVSDDASIRYESAGDETEPTAMLVDPDRNILITVPETFYGKAIDIGISGGTQFRLKAPCNAAHTTKYSGELIEAAWQWYDSATEGYDEAGNFVEGVWTDVPGTVSTDADAGSTLSPADAGKEVMLMQGSKFRLRMTVDSTSVQVDKADVTTAVGLILTTGTAGTFVTQAIDKQAALNDTETNPVHEGNGIGVDPS